MVNDVSIPQTSVSPFPHCLKQDGPHLVCCCPCSLSHKWSCSRLTHSLPLLPESSLHTHHHYSWKLSASSWAAQGHGNWASGCCWLCSIFDLHSLPSCLWKRTLYGTTPRACQEEFPRCQNSLVLEPSIRPLSFYPCPLLGIQIESSLYSRRDPQKNSFCCGFEELTTSLETLYSNKYIK